MCVYLYACACVRSSLTIVATIYNVNVNLISLPFWTILSALKSQLKSVSCVDIGLRASIAHYIFRSFSINEPS